MQHFASRGPWCLLAGAITTIAVAWGCALWSPLEFTTLQFLHSATGVQGQSFSWTWNERPGHGVNWVWIQPGVFRVDPPDPPAAPPRWVQLPDEKISLIRYLASGWPLRCMNARLIERSTVNVRRTRVVGARQTVFAWDYAYIIEPARAIDPFTAKIVPLNPHVPELIANSIFWGLVWYVVIMVVARVRSLFRTRKGVCPKCRYDLRNLTRSRCPECGTAIATAIPRSPNRPEEAPQS